MRRTLLMLTCTCLFLAAAGRADQRSQPSVSRSPHGKLNLACENCHTFTSWKPLRNIIEFDHSRTRYPLRGLHQGVSCTQCHVKLVFSNIGTKCADCHADIHRRQFGADCERCHTVRGWQESLQALRTHQNRFPLVGAHAALTCDDCHKGAAVSQFQGLSTDCIACHTQTFAQAKFPNHQSAGFPTTCQACHNMDNWLGANFDHAKFTGFALTGMHATLDCTACHLNGNFNVTSTACASCHLRDFTGTQNPNHVQAGFPQDCAVCHNTANWTSTTFNHNTFTTFPLTGAHVNVACNQCHINGRFAGTPSDCASCHLADYQKTTDPNHAAAGFPTNCSVCHTTTSWQGANFNHATTGFALTGAHAPLACQSCHVGGNFNLTTAACVSCHLNDFTSTQNPNHVQAGFPQDCTVCHTTVNWTSTTFNHNAFTTFPLTGAHVNVACIQCHINGRFAGTPRDCASCHLADYQKTTDPNHVAAGFPTDCSVCHTTAGWQGAQFNHAATGFPLTGAHAPLACQSCHVGGNFNLTSTACVSCHLKDYNNTTNPNHQASGIPQQCEVCHTTTAWTPASFNHDLTGFPLTGAHKTVPCASCHIGGRYAGTPTDCFSCHKSDFLATTDPNHTAAAFPTNCTLCHTTSSWLGATFNHTWFPIYSGTHAGKWTTCGDCHVNPSNYTAFSCTTCHAHDKSTMDAKHQDVRGYVYNSQNCYSCHPTGQSGG